MIQEAENLKENIEEAEKKYSFSILNLSLMRTYCLNTFYVVGKKDITIENLLSTFTAH